MVPTHKANCQTGLECFTNMTKKEQLLWRIHSNWQVRQADLSLDRLWCSLELCQTCLKDWSHLSDDHWTCPCPIPFPVMVFAFKTMGYKISQPEPSQGNKIKPEPWSKSPNYANNNNKVSLNRIHPLTGLTKPRDAPAFAGEEAAESSAALCRWQLLLSF